MIVKKGYYDKLKSNKIKVFQNHGLSMNDKLVLLVLSLVWAAVFEIVLPSGSVICKELVQGWDKTQYFSVFAVLDLDSLKLIK